MEKKTTPSTRLADMQQARWLMYKATDELQTIEEAIEFMEIVSHAVTALSNKTYDIEGTINGGNHTTERPLWNILIAASNVLRLVESTQITPQKKEL